MERMTKLIGCVRTQAAEVGTLLREERAQGTMEYAILVAVLVVVAIAAITAVGPMIGDMWTAIEDGVTEATGAVR
ncbi:class III signal peptide-containing protein [Collinsella ihumii]|uniref:Class III signal peptide-containing protein n=1 Tax=Collinsella ihumii TaxID=1720204 RepID=A0AAW7JXS4_9ACTN|nr:class III signal peptide-containing protein [Collinsella ihumii]MDN0069588.1 class III signal peptide-containing protein [Collinsella ihumii]